MTLSRGLATALSRTSLQPRTAAALSGRWSEAMASLASPTGAESYTLPSVSNRHLSTFVAASQKKQPIAPHCLSADFKKSLEKQSFSTLIWSYSLSYATPESDFCGGANIPSSSRVLPEFYRDALRDEEQAIVITTAEAPYTIVHVNRVWEDLCGYSRNEVWHQTMDVIQGPDTNRELVKGAIDKVLETHEPQDVYLVNYNKDGSDFINHLRAGPLYLNNSDEDLHFLVGVLEKVSRDEVPLRQVSF